MNIFSYIKKQSIFKDSRAVTMMIIGLVLLLVEIVYVIINIQQREFKIPVRYSSYYYVNLSQRGEWYSLYGLPLFAAVAYLVNLILAIRIHVLHKGAAVALMATTLIILVFALIVSRALLGLD